MRAWPAVIVVVAAGLAAACSGAEGEASCASLLDWNGVRYEGSGHRLPPGLGARLGEGTEPGCDDGGGRVEERTVPVHAIVGVDPAVAVAVPESDAVYLAPEYSGPGVTYPEALEPVLLGPSCEEPRLFVVTGELVGAEDRRFALTVTSSDVRGFEGVDLELQVANDAVLPSVPLSRYGAFDRLRARVRCRAADLPNRTFLAEEVSFLANGNYCGRFAEPCHRAEGPPHPALAGGSSEQHALLGEIVAGIGPSLLTSLTVRGTDRGVALAVGLPEGADLRARWEAWLVAGAFRDGSRERGLPVVVSLALGKDPPQAIEREPWEGGYDDPRAVSREVHRADGRSSVHFDAYALLRPDGFVPAITFLTDDAPTFLRIYLPRFLEELGDPSRYEGFYVSVESPEGKRYWEWAISSRLATSEFRASPGLEGCTPGCPAG